MYSDLPVRWAEQRGNTIYLDGKPVFDTISGAKIYLLRDEEGELIAQIKIRQAANGVLAEV